MVNHNFVGSLVFFPFHSSFVQIEKKVMLVRFRKRNFGLKKFPIGAVIWKLLIYKTILLVPEMCENDIHICYICYSRKLRYKHYLQSLWPFLVFDVVLLFESNYRWYVVHLTWSKKFVNVLKFIILLPTVLYLNCSKLWSSNNANNIIQHSRYLLLLYFIFRWVFYQLLKYCTNMSNTWNSNLIFWYQR